MASQSIRRLSMDELTSQRTGPLYVMNCASDVSPPGGDVHISYTLGSGQAAQPLRVPLTYLPINLAAAAPRPAILRSQSFHHAIEAGLIAAISEQDAKRILAQPGAAEEAARLRQQQEALKAALQAARVGRSDTTLVIRDTKTSASDMNSEPVAASARDASSVFSGEEPATTVTGTSRSAAFSMDEATVPLEAELTASFKAQIQKMLSMSEVEAGNRLKTMGELDMIQVQYILDTLTKHKRICAWAQRTLNGE